jgi:hypothetical protein
VVVVLLVLVGGYATVMEEKGVVAVCTRSSTKPIGGGERLLAAVPLLAAPLCSPDPRL